MTKKRIIGLEVKSVNYTSDKGADVDITAHGFNGMSQKELRDTLKRDFGDNVSFPDERPRDLKNMATAAFSASRWKSPWVPQSDKDREAKPPYNPDMN